MLSFNKISLRLGVSTMWCMHACLHPHTCMLHVFQHSPWYPDAAVPSRRASWTDSASELGPSAPRTCKLCGGSGHLPCRACGGAGRLALGGHHKNNQVNVSRLVGEHLRLCETFVGAAVQEVAAWRCQQGPGLAGLLAQMVIHLSLACNHR